jgi:hypothetical protein
MLHSNRVCNSRVILTHTLYIKATKVLRKSRQLLISYATFEKITTSTVARWLRSVLDRAGIDTGFLRHSPSDQPLYQQHLESVLLSLF